MFTLTSAAARQILQTAEDTGAQTLALRIAARLGADGAIECGMGFDEPTDEDLKLDIEGVAIVIAEEHQALLEDTLLDYVELEAGEFHFIFGDQSSLGDELLGSDTNFAAASCAAPCGRTKGSANLGSDPKNSCGGCASKAQA
jgi:iron-sulfur cluster assembly protein